MTAAGIEIPLDDQPGARVTIVGSGTMQPDAVRGSAGHVVECGSVRVLLDCGTGTLHGLARCGVPWDQLTHIALTHFHSDHIGDLAALLWALRYVPRPPRSASLTLIGPVGTSVLLERLAAIYGSAMTDPGCPLDVIEVAPGTELTLGHGVTLTCAATVHTEASLAYRVGTPAGVVGYTGDTGPSDAVGQFMKGVSLLICECAQSDPPEKATHLSPRGVAELAQVAQPGLLALTHVYSPLTPAEAVRQVEDGGFEGVTLAAFDGMKVRLEGGRATVDHSSAQD